MEMIKDYELYHKNQKYWQDHWAFFRRARYLLRLTPTKHYQMSSEFHYVCEYFDD